MLSQNQLNDLLNYSDQLEKAGYFNKRPEELTFADNLRDILPALGAGVTHFGNDVLSIFGTVPEIAYDYIYGDDGKDNALLRWTKDNEERINDFWGMQDRTGWGGKFGQGLGSIAGSYGLAALTGGASLLGQGGGILKTLGSLGKLAALAGAEEGLSEAARAYRDTYYNPDNVTGTGDVAAANAIKTALFNVPIGYATGKLGNIASQGLANGAARYLGNGLGNFVGGFAGRGLGEGTQEFLQSNVSTYNSPYVYTDNDTQNVGKGILANLIPANASDVLNKLKQTYTGENLRNALEEGWYGFLTGGLTGGVDSHIARRNALNQTSNYQQILQDKALDANNRLAERIGGSIEGLNQADFRTLQTNDLVNNMIKSLQDIQKEQVTAQDITDRLNKVVGNTEEQRVGKNGKLETVYKPTKMTNLIADLYSALNEDNQAISDYKANVAEQQRIAAEQADATKTLTPKEVDNWLYRMENSTVNPVSLDDVNRFERYINNSLSVFGERASSKDPDNLLNKSEIAQSKKLKAALEKTIAFRESLTNPTVVNAQGNVFTKQNAQPKNVQQPVQNTESEQTGQGDGVIVTPAEQTTKQVENNAQTTDNSQVGYRANNVPVLNLTGLDNPGSSEVQEPVKDVDSTQNTETQTKTYNATDPFENLNKDLPTNKKTGKKPSSWMDMSKEDLTEYIKGFNDKGVDLGPQDIADKTNLLLEQTKNKNEANKYSDLLDVLKTVYGVAPSIAQIDETQTNGNKEVNFTEKQRQELNDGQINNDATIARINKVISNNNNRETLNFARASAEKSKTVATNYFNALANDQNADADTKKSYADAIAIADRQITEIDKRLEDLDKGIKVENGSNARIESFLESEESGSKSPVGDTLNELEESNDRTAVYEGFKDNGLGNKERVARSMYKNRNVRFEDPSFALTTIRYKLSQLLKDYGVDFSNIRSYKDIPAGVRNQIKSYTTNVLNSLSSDENITFDERAVASELGLSDSKITYGKLADAIIDNALGLDSKGTQILKKFNGISSDNSTGIYNIEDERFINSILNKHLGRNQSVSIDDVYRTANTLNSASDLVALHNAIFDDNGNPSRQITEWLKKGSGVEYGLKADWANRLKTNLTNVFETLHSQLSKTNSTAVELFNEYNSLKERDSSARFINFLTNYIRENNLSPQDINGLFQGKLALDKKLMGKINIGLEQNGKDGVVATADEKGVKRTGKSPVAVYIGDGKYVLFGKSNSFNLANTQFKRFYSKELSNPKTEQQTKAFPMTDVKQTPDNTIPVLPTKNSPASERIEQKTNEAVERDEGKTLVQSFVDNTVKRINTILDYMKKRNWNSNEKGDDFEYNDGIEKTERSPEEQIIHLFSKDRGLNQAMQDEAVRRKVFDDNVFERMRELAADRVTETEQDLKPNEYFELFSQAYKDVQQEDLFSGIEESSATNNDTDTATTQNKELTDDDKKNIETNIKSNFGDNVSVTFSKGANGQNVVGIYGNGFTFYIKDSLSDVALSDEQIKSIADMHGLKGKERADFEANPFSHIRGLKDTVGENTNILRVAKGLLSRDNQIMHEAYHMFETMFSNSDEIKNIKEIKIGKARSQKALAELRADAYQEYKQNPKAFFRNNPELASAFAKFDERFLGIADKLSSTNEKFGNWIKGKLDFFKKTYLENITEEQKKRYRELNKKQNLDKQELTAEEKQFVQDYKENISIAQKQEEVTANEEKQKHSNDMRDTYGRIYDQLSDDEKSTLDSESVIRKVNLTPKNFEEARMSYLELAHNIDVIENIKSERQRLDGPDEKRDASYDRDIAYYRKQAEEIRSKFKKEFGNKNTTVYAQLDFDSKSAKDEYNDVLEKYHKKDKYMKPRKGWMEAPNGNPTNLQERQWVQARTLSFKKWFGDWERGDKNASKIVDKNGEPLVVYHGTPRGDLIGNTFESKEATSGPMVYFTNEEDLADRYRYYTNRKNNKQSIDDELYGDKYDIRRFSIKLNGKDVSLDKVYSKLSQDKQTEIKEKAPHIYPSIYDTSFIYDPKSKVFDDPISGYNAFLKRANGDPIVTLFDEYKYAYHHDGLETYSQIFNLLGLGDVSYQKPIDYSKVFPVFLNIKSPFYTSNVAEIEDELRKAGKIAAKEYVKNNTSFYGTNEFDKRYKSPQQWLKDLTYTIQQGQNEETGLWYTIPDFVTDKLKELGYDGVVEDTGPDKNITVYIPFYSSQIKSAVENNGEFNSNDNNMYAQLGPSKVNDGIEVRINPSGKITMATQPSIVENAKQIVKYITNGTSDSKVESLWQNFTNYAREKLTGDNFKGLSQRTKEVLYKMKYIDKNAAQSKADFSGAVSWENIVKAAKIDSGIDSPKYGDLGKYLSYKMLEDEARIGQKTPLTQAEYQSAISEYERKYPEFKKVASYVKQHTDRILDNYLKAGMITQKQYDAMKKKQFYAPLYSKLDLNSDDAFNNVVKRSLSTKQMANHWGNGDLNEVVNPLESLMKMEFKSYEAVERKKSIQELLKIGEKDKGTGADLFTISDEKIDPMYDVRFFENGKEKWLHSDSQYYMKNFVDNPVSGNEKGLFKIAKNLASLVRKGYNSTPTRAIHNFINDSFEAMTNVKEYNPLSRSYASLISVIKQDRNFIRAAKAGAFQGIGRDSITKSHNDIQSFMLNNEKLSLKNFLPKYLQHMENLMEISERVTRLGVFNTLVENGMTDEQAASKAVSLLNFSAGSEGIKSWNKYTPFFNSSIQGNVAFARSLKANPFRFAASAFLKYLPVVAATYMFNHRDKETEEVYNDMPQWRKDGFFNLVLSKDTVVSIPNGHLAGLLFHGITERFIDWMRTGDAPEYKKLMDSVVGEVTPNIIPTAFLGPLELSLNKNFHTGKDIIPKSEKNRYLPHDQYGAFTSGTTVLMSKMLSNMGLEVSPRMIEHVVKNYGGNLGKNVLRTSDYVVSGGETDIPLASDFVSKPIAGNAESNFLDALEEATSRFNSAKKSFEEGERGRDTRLIMSSDKRLDMFNKQFKKPIQVLNKEISDIEKNHRMPRKVKDRQISMREKKIRVISSRGLKMLKQMTDRWN